MRKLILLALPILAAIALVGQPATATRPAPKVELCHLADGPAQAGKITVAAAAAYHAHYLQHAEDIIPPFVYQGATYSLNWDAAGQAIFNNGCVEPEVPVECPPGEHEHEGECEPDHEEPEEPEEPETPEAPTPDEPEEPAGGSSSTFVPETLPRTS